jgi:hypothetical protein
MALDYRPEASRLATLKYGKRPSETTQRGF